MRSANNGAYLAEGGEMGSVSGYIYDKGGAALGFVVGEYIYLLNGTSVGRYKGTHVYRLDGEYVGEMYSDMVVDKGMIMGRLTQPSKPGLPGTRQPHKRVPIKPPYPDSFNRLIKE